MSNSRTVLSGAASLLTEEAPGSWFRVQSRVRGFRVQGSGQKRMHSLNPEPNPELLTAFTIADVTSAWKGRPSRPRAESSSSALGSAISSDDGMPEQKLAREAEIPYALVAW